MKSINSLIKWIFFVPVFALSLAIALFNGFSSGAAASSLGTNQNGLAQIITFAVLGLFAVCFVASLFDRKTSPAHILRKNIFCGVTSIGAALAMAAHAAFDVTNLINGTADAGAISVITIMLTGVAGVTMLYLGLNHFVGKNTTGKLSVLYLSLPLWCASHLVERFLRNTATPVAASESLDLVMFVALALFFMNVAMIHSVISIKNSVKATINYGLPAVVIAFVYSINLIFSVSAKENFVFLDLVPAIAYIFIALYTMGFVAELSFKAKTVDEQIILVAEEEKDTTFSDEYYDDSEDVEDTTAQENDYEEENYEETYDGQEDAQFESDFEAVGVSEDKVTFFEEEEDDDIYSEDNISFDEPVAAEPVVAEEKSAPISPFIGVIRTVDDSDEEDIDDASDEIKPETAALTQEQEEEETAPAVEENVTSENEDDNESSVANELFRAAQKRDNKKDKNKKSVDSAEPVEVTEDETSEPELNAVKNEEKPKGPTTREAIMYDEEDFILTVQNNDVTDNSSVKDEEISAFILEDEETDDDIAAKKSYEERLDEIDRLIISIQGGEEPEKK